MAEREYNNLEPQARRILDSMRNNGVSFGRHSQRCSRYSIDKQVPAQVGVNSMCVTCRERPTKFIFRYHHEGPVISSDLVTAHCTACARKIIVGMAERRGSAETSLPAPDHLAYIVCPQLSCGISSST